MAMGWKHAVWVLMQINLAIVERAIRHSKYYTHAAILNRRRWLQDGVDLSLRPAVYVHVDDFGVLSDQAPVADGLCTEIRATAVALGFDTTMETAATPKRYVGLRAQCSPALWLPDAAKAGLLDRFIEHLLHRKRVKVKWVHTAVSVYTLSLIHI